MSIKIGDLGEKLVIQWLESKSYRVLHYKWRCRWGEIDVIAEDKNTSTLAFVEVKTRSDSNWDSDGLEAVSLSKQKKISRSAALFLGKNTQYTDFYMRFDVALVRYNKQLLMDYETENSTEHTELSKSFVRDITNNSSLKLIDYLENAFESF